MSVALTVYSHPPPTTNTLNSQQRTRLIRSTRKLGAVLGTTPYLLEDDTPFTLVPLRKTTSRALKRQGSIFTHRQVSLPPAVFNPTPTAKSHHPSSSAPPITLRSAAPGTQNTEPCPINPPTLSPTHGRCRSGDKTPQLCMRLNMVPVPSDDRVASPPSPTAVSPIIPDDVEIRRRRMAKLTRYLGETIPAELVSAAKSSPEPATISPNRVARKRSQSVHVMGTNAASIGDDSPSPGQTKQDWVGEWNRPNIKDVQRELRNLKTG